MFVVNIICFILLVILMCLLTKEMISKHVFNTMSENLKNKSEQRREAEEQKAIEEGIENHGIFFKIDLALLKSGIQVLFPFITTEVFILCMACLSVGIFVLSQFIFKSVVISVIFVSASIFFVYAVICLLLNRNTYKVEENIMKFVNLTENYSKASDDITEILRYTVPFLDEPLKSAVNSCVSEIQITGDTYAAFKRLEIRISHPQFGELIRNIEICSRHDTDYALIIRKNRQMLQEYLSEKKVRKSMANSARLNIVILYAGAVAAIIMAENIGELSLINLLLTTSAGNILMLLVFAVIIFSAWKMMKMGS